MIEQDKLEQSTIISAAQRSFQPLCLYGPPGCGKSRLINHTWARDKSESSLTEFGPVSLNLDDSIDAKSLVGTFRSSLTEAGRFEWVDGLLVELIRKGRWLVLEDVDKVNQDILSILPRTGDTVFEIRETGEKVPIHPGFGLLGTSTLINQTKLRRTLPNWLFLACDYPSNLDSIVQQSLPPLVATLVLGAYRSVQSTTSAGHYERVLGLHDLFRAVSRVQSIMSSLKLSESSTFITEYQKSRIGTELVELFANHSPFPDRRTELIHAIESALECELTLDTCPAFSSDNSRVSIGDLSLPRKNPKSASSDSNSFTLTSVHLQAMQRVARCITCSESVLVVGDTGVGKTTTIQFLARELGVRMHVYNFSDQTEGSDLIGGLKPVMETEKLIKQCESLIRSTLPESSVKSGLAIMDYISEKLAKRDMNGVMKAIEKTAARAIALFEASPSHSSEELLQWKALMTSCVGAGKIFRFIEGPLIKAVKNGDWILLDEINLAPPDVLRILNGLIENHQIAIPETGEVVDMHSDFRLFAAMNPPHLGRGKRALPASLRSRFTEIYCQEVTERSDLVKLVQQSLERDLTMATLTQVVPKVVDLYLELKCETFSSQLSSLEGGPPVFSLRSLSRALEFAKRLLRSPQRAPGALSGDGRAELVDSLKVSLSSAIDARSEKIVIKLIDSTFVVKRDHSPAVVGERPGWVRVEGQWIATGHEVINQESNFVITESVRRNLRKLAVCLAGGKVARPPILCEGSTGAGKTSLVTYLATVSGHRLVRINNHEHTDLQDYFGQYVSDVTGGSGALVFQEGPLVSAVRNGFWVLLDELNLAPTEVLEALNRLLDDNRELVIPETGETVKAHPDFVLFATQNPVTLEYAGRKSLSRAFRNRFIDVQIDELPSEELGIILSAKCKVAESTANRMLSTYTELSRLRRLDRVLSGRDSALVTVRDLIRWALRAPTTREEIALEGYLVLAERLRTQDQRNLVLEVLEDKVGVKNLSKIVEKFYIDESNRVWSNDTHLVRTNALNRALALISRAMAAGESVLLVGETATGKTSASQLVSEIFNKSLGIINCHQHLESGDLIGQVCPMAGGVLAWKDGPLVEACRAGSWILLDEVNLADDSVVERLNSLLDIDFRAISLAEKPREETVVAHSDFRLICTMNPGNDFGKKELSAALRNRFSEIWIEAVEFNTIQSTGYSMVRSSLKIPERDKVAEKICKCIDFAIQNVPSLHVSSRDAILWCAFVNQAGSAEALSHGAAVVLLDSLDPNSAEYTRMSDFLVSELGSCGVSNEWIRDAWNNFQPHQSKSLGPFPLSDLTSYSTGGFSLNAPTSASNFARLIRAMFGSRRPILLHGDPGAGKSSVVAALARFSGVNLVRINLSDQTELADILGQNIPVEGNEFVWKDGILLEAISRGDWVLLDELNLAPQPVLEGLNALLDHRAEIYVPAIDRLVKCPPSFRLFATQNEASKGDGRKMLPRSLLSRFSRLRVSAMTLEDLAIAARESMHGSSEIVESAVRIISGLSEIVPGASWNLRDISRLLKCVGSECSSLNPDLAWMILGTRISDLKIRNSARSLVYSILGADVASKIDAAKYVISDSVGSGVDILSYQSEALSAASVALRSCCHVILSGESGCGKKSILKFIGGGDSVTIRMHSQMDTSDLIGQFIQVRGAHNGATEFRWSDSPLTVAVRNGGWIVLSNAHCCPPAILDRLNALIEDNGVLVIPEKGEAETVVPSDNFRLILVTDRVDLLSSAIRNRCVEISLGNASNVYDRVRVAMAAGITDSEISSRIARSVCTVRESNQASLLVRAGLAPEKALEFIAPNVHTDSVVNTAHISTSNSMIDREFAASQSHQWFLESAVSGSDFAARLARLGLAVSSDVSLDFERIKSSPLKRRLFVVILLMNQGVLRESVSGFSLGELHALSLNQPPASGDQGVTCHDHLLVPLPESSMVFSGAFRAESVVLFDLVVQLAARGGSVVPSAALVEFAATAVALRARRSPDALEKERRIIETFQEIMAKNEQKETEPGIDLIDEAFRIAGITDIDTLVRCGIRLFESDLILAGIRRSLEWSENEKSKAEFRFSNLVNRFILSPSGRCLVSVLRCLMDETASIPCGTIGARITQFRSLMNSVSIETDTPTCSVKEIVDRIKSLVIPEHDVHHQRRLAVSSIEAEAEKTKLETELFRASRAIAGGVGADEAGPSEWLEILTHRFTSITDMGIYVRPVDQSSYGQLRYLISEFQSRLDDIVIHRNCVSLVSFVRTILNYAHYVDVTRSLGLCVLELVASISSQTLSAIQSVVPISDNRSVTVLLKLVDSSPACPLSARTMLEQRLTELVEESAPALQEDSEDQVIVQGSVEIQLSSLVEDNDKARADAAVAALHKELFPDTYGEFMREMRRSEQIGLEDDEAVQVRPANPLGTLDEIAVSLVARSETSMEDILLHVFSSESRSDSDCPELIALTKLRLGRTVQELEEAVVVAPVREEVIQDEDQKDNREQKLKLSEFIKNRGQMISFYSPKGGKEAVGLLSNPLSRSLSLLTHLQSSVEEIADHPDLVHAISVVEKALKLSSDCSAICALQAGEYALECMQKLEKSIPSRYWSESALNRGTQIMAALTSTIARLRASEVASWKDLRVMRETTLAKSGSGKWLVHLWKMASDKSLERTEVFETTLSWLRTSGLIQFAFRLALVSALADLSNNAVLKHVCSLATLWSALVKNSVREARTELNKSVQALVKEIQFRLGGRHYSGEKFRLDTKRSHMQLATVLRRFEESVSKPVEEIVGAASALKRNSAKEPSDISRFISETMDSIRTSPADKASKGMKQRLVSDLEVEVREYLQSLPGYERTGQLKFTSDAVGLILNAAPSCLAAHLIKDGMQIVGLPAVCKNNDVKPATIAEWRSLSSYAISAFNSVSGIERSRNRNLQIRKWMENSDSVIPDPCAVRSAIEWIDECVLLVNQFNVLGPLVGLDRIEISAEIPSHISQQLGEKTLFVNRKWIENDLVSMLTRLVTQVYENPTVRRLFSQSGKKFDQAVMFCRNLISQLACMQFHLCVDATSQFVENPVEAESVGETILSILDFTIFLHEEGLCSKQEEQEQQQGETTDWQTGTGLGEGSGVNDKSDEIEDAGQFDDTEQPSGDQGDKEDCDEPDLDKGVDANADQGMNESDVEEHNMPQKDEEDDDDREMGDVDMNDGGKVDESGAPDNEDDEEVEESGDNVELKNEAEANEGEDDTRAQEKEAKDAAGDGNHEEGEEEGEGEEDREDKIEAFVDQGREDPEEHNGDEMGDDEDIEEGLEQEGEEGEAEEEMEEDGPENPEQEAEILETGKPEDEQQESEETEETINQQGIDSTAGGAHEDDHKPDESLAAKSGQEEQRDGADGGQDSSESAQAMADRGGMDRSQKNQQGAAKNQVKPAPCPLEPNSKEALDEWLKEISEIIEKNANEQKTSGGDSGELDQESEQATVAEAQRAGATNQTPQKEDEEMKYADEKTSPSESKDAEEGVDRDQVMQDVSEEPVGAPEQQSMEETTEEVAEQKVHKQTSGPSLDETEEKRKDGELDASPGAPVQNPESNLEVTDLNLQDTEVKVNRLCNELTEKLLAVLEPTKRGRLEGFFRAGKRISMRRVLSWIASDYRKDKFWLRRTRPSHRDYRVMICMDNTMSMRNNGVGEMALVCVSALAQSLQLLEVGKVGVLSFGTDVREICPLDDAKSGTSCSSVEDLARHLRFNEESSSSFSDAFPSVIHKCAEVFRSGEEAAGSLALVITDGRFDKDRCRPFVQELIADGHIPVLIVMDANKEESILSVTSVHFEEDTTGPVKKRKVVRKPFLSQSDCPFPFYAVIQDPSQLPTTLADILRQWIEVFAK